MDGGWWEDVWVFFLKNTRTPNSSGISFKHEVEGSPPWNLLPEPHVPGGYICQPMYQFIKYLRNLVSFFPNHSKPICAGNKVCSKSIKKRYPQMTSKTVVGPQNILSEHKKHLHQQMTANK